MKRKVINPSSASYLLRCPRCFWIKYNVGTYLGTRGKYKDKVCGGLAQPGGFPAILNHVHKQMEMVNGQRSENILPGVAGKFIGVEKFSGGSYRGYSIQGRMDGFIRLDTGHVSVDDWKVTPDIIEGLYDGPMLIYGYCAESEVESLIPVSVYPHNFRIIKPGLLESDWVLKPRFIDYDKEKAKWYMDKMIEIIERPTIPETTKGKDAKGYPKCSYCHWYDIVKGL